VPSAIAIAPSVNALFVADSGANAISAYAVNSDGSLTAASGTTPTGTNPVAMDIDRSGKFLFVANQGSSSVSVFTINGTGLTAVAGSPFTTIPVGLSFPNGTLPSAVSVSASGKFLYVANQLANFVSAFAVDPSSGVLKPLRVPFYLTWTSPDALNINPSGAFLYVANSGSSNVSAFAICDAVLTSCTNQNAPDGTLTAVPNSPFPSGLSPRAIAADPNFNFLYVVGADTVSQYSYGAGTGALTALSPATISTGLAPVSIAVRPGATGTNVGNTTTNPTDYVYVANSGAGTISTYTLPTASGILTVLGSPVPNFADPSAVAAK
jgi:6-phosphogluconolactonase (cycloisomerase 2 family)